MQRFKLLSSTYSLMCLAILALSQFRDRNLGNNKIIKNMRARDIYNFTFNIGNVIKMLD